MPIQNFLYLRQLQNDIFQCQGQCQQNDNEKVCCSLFEKLTAGGQVAVRRGLSCRENVRTLQAAYSISRNLSTMDLFWRR